METAGAHVKRIYKFIAGNSRVTPIGIALAIAVALFFRDALAWWAAPCYLGILLVTLAASTFEPVQ
jgi:hypothetical protein